MMNNEQIIERYENIDSYVNNAIAKDILNEINNHERFHVSREEVDMVKDEIEKGKLDIDLMIEEATRIGAIGSAKRKEYNKLSEDMFGEAESMYLTMVAKNRMDGFDSEKDTVESEARDSFIESLLEIFRSNPEMSLSDIPVEIKIGKKGMKIQQKSKFNGLYLAYILGIIGDDDRMEE